MTTTQTAPTPAAAIVDTPAAPSCDPTCAPAGADCCAPLTREPLGAAEAEVLAKKLKAIADPTRLRLLSLISATAGTEACVCDLQELVDLSQPTVSHHLKVLTDAGFLTRTKRGTWAYFALVPGALTEISEVLAP
ncbi:metalloregulator ArsR/SmtB family transcription factor [Brevibacterium samyangense]